MGSRLVGCGIDPLSPAEMLEWRDQWVEFRARYEAWRPPTRSSRRALESGTHRQARPAAARLQRPVAAGAADEAQRKVSEADRAQGAMAELTTRRATGEPSATRSPWPALSSRRPRPAPAQRGRHNAVYSLCLLRRVGHRPCAARSPQRAGAQIRRMGRCPRAIAGSGWRSAYEAASMHWLTSWASRGGGGRARKRSVGRSGVRAGAADPAGPGRGGSGAGAEGCRKPGSRWPRRSLSRGRCRRLRLRDEPALQTLMVSLKARQTWIRRSSDCARHSTFRPGRPAGRLHRTGAD